MGRQQLNINLPDDVAAYLEGVPNKTDTVVRAIRQVMNAERNNELEARVRCIEDTLAAHGIELLSKNRIVYVEREGLKMPIVINEGELIMPKDAKPNKVRARKPAE